MALTAYITARDDQNVDSVMIALPIICAFSTVCRRRRRGRSAARSCRRRAGPVAPYLPQANRPSESVPQIPQNAVHRNGADGIVDAQPFEQFDAA